MLKLMAFVNKHNSMSYDIIVGGVIKLKYHRKIPLMRLFKYVSERVCCFMIKALKLDRNKKNNNSNSSNDNNNEQNKGMNNYVRYKAIVDGLVLSRPIEFEPANCQFIKKVFLKNFLEGASKNFAITFYLIDSAPVNVTGNELFIKERDNIVDNIKFELNQYFGELICNDSCISNRHSLAKDIICSVVVPSEDEELKMIEESGRNNRELSQEEKMYCDILSVKNKTLQYMLFYSMLEMKFSKQDKIDDFICEKNSSVQKFPKKEKRGKNSDVTIYTRLRNDIGHAKGDVEIASTVQKIEGCLPNLKKYVKLALEQCA